MSLEKCLEIAARIWCDKEYEKVVMNPYLAEEIAKMLKYEADKQGK